MGPRAPGPSRTGIGWGFHGGNACIRLTGPGVDELVHAGRVRVYPTDALDTGSVALPPMTGRLGVDREGAWFVPRFGFTPGTSYTVVLPVGEVVLARPADDGLSSTTVTAIHPSEGSIPYNQLRLYVHFSAPMSEGFATECVHVVDELSGGQLADALLPMSAELWDRDRKRVTLLFDPGRIKRGLLPQRQAGYPLVEGRPVRVVIDQAWADATGRRLTAGFERRYEVGPDARAHVDPAAWRLSPPGAATREPLLVDFDRRLDHGLLQRCLTVQSGGEVLSGSVGVGEEERSWAFFPTGEWSPGPYQLVVDHRLEDLAGNSLTRVFDRDLSNPANDPRPARPVPVPFKIR